MAQLRAAADVQKKRQPPWPKATSVELLGQLTVQLLVQLMHPAARDAHRRMILTVQASQKWMLK